MVVVRLPPPTGGISPQFTVLEPNTKLLRIFDPTRHNATALGFRNYGPISRFDHQRFDSDKPGIDKDRGILYFGFSLSCCLIEIFGDSRIIQIQEQQIAIVTLTQSLKLLDLRGAAAMRAGTVTAVSAITQRDISQAWGRYFYEHPEFYAEIDGLIFSGAHNGEDAISLYERAISVLSVAKVQELPLKHPDLVQPILEIAENHNLLVMNS